MLLAAARDWDVDLSRSVMIGDSDKDMQAARAAGVRPVRYQGGSVAELVSGIVG